MAQKITVDGKEYDLDALSETARSQVVNLRATDQEIARTEALLAILQTARQAYANVLRGELERADSPSQ